MRARVLVAATVATLGVVAACSGDAADPSAASPEQGRDIAEQMACAACHTTTGAQSVGPTWQGLYGSERPLEDGSTVTADEDYLRESIVDPNAKVVDGFPSGVMPQDFGERLDAEEIAAVIAYIQSLE